MVKRREVVKAEAPQTVTRRRVRSEGEDPPPAASYFAAGDEKDLEFIHTGCSIFDAVLGGGYVLGRIVNLVGDKSSGKTLMAIEASANFAKEYPEGEIHYAEAEAAFDSRYAAALGMPIERVQFKKDIFTVEDLFEDLEKTAQGLGGRPGLYIVDSLDALSDRAEQERKIDEGSYNMQKQKKLSELFRRKVKEFENTRLCIIIISQIRDKIGVTFGETKTRSGGKALDFYASQVIWLAEIEKMKKTIDKVERIIGVRVRARCKKNKIGLPFRECEYPIIFGYGVDDLTAGVEWLLESGMEEELGKIGVSKAGYKVRIGNLRNKGGSEVLEFRKTLNELINRSWKTIEMKFLPQASKY